MRKLFRIQFLYGSGVCQMWFTEFPFLREFPLGTKTDRLKKLLMKSKTWELARASNSAETYVYAHN